MNRWNLLLLISALLIFSPASFSEKSASAKYVEAKSLNLKVLLKTKKDWHVSAYQSPEAKDEPGAGGAAKVCFWTDKTKKESGCEFINSANEFDPSTTYPHQNVSRLETVKLDKSRTGVLLSAEFSGGGSGLLVRQQLWTYSPKQDSFDETLKLNMTEQGEAKFISTGPLAGYLVTADAYWQLGESHFEPHRFSIDVYKYNNNDPGSYIKILSYITAKKYPSLDEGNINVVSPELAATIGKLKAVYGPKLSPI